MDIYFAGAIRGGREKVNDYQKIINKLEEIGNVLTTHIANKEIGDKGENNMTPKEIYDRDVVWLKSSE